MKYLFFIIFFTGAIPSICQDQIRIKGGVLSTNTSISEYNRGLSYFYYDSVTLDTRRTTPQLNVEIDIELSKHFFLTTGLAYSRKGLASIYYDNGDYWYAAKQEYMGMIFQLKYHRKIKDNKFGVFAAAGFKADQAVGGPNGAQIATDGAAKYFHAFGTFHQLDFSLLTVVGISYKLGPGDVVLDFNFQKGLSDVLQDTFVVGRTFSIGASLGYSIYL